MRKYIKKPVKIEAIEWTGNNSSDILAFCPNCYMVTGDSLKIHTLEGPMSASIGDYVIKGLVGEFYACKPDIFLMTYDEDK